MRSFDEPVRVLLDSQCNWASGVVFCETLYVRHWPRVRILILHSRYRSGLISGENRVVAEEANLLRRGGHEVEVIAPSPDEFRRATLAARSLNSFGIGRVVANRVRASGAEIVHCHNLYPAFGAGVLRDAERSGAAVVVTLHNYRFMCLAGTFFRDGRVCQDCLGRLPWPGVIHACYRESRSESAVLAGSLVNARVSRRLSSVHRFFAVSTFVREKHVEAGFPEERILVKPNFVPEQTQRSGPGTYFLVLSRLSVEKNISEIVSCWDKDLGELRIAGDGPELAELERLGAGRDVQFDGAVSPEEIPSLLTGARALLVPSSCFEGQPRVVLEAYAAGVPVIASRIGGLAEAVIEDETGITVQPGDRKAWRSAVQQFADDRLSVRLGDGARSLWRARFSPRSGLTMLEAGYDEALYERNRSQHEDGPFAEHRD